MKKIIPVILFLSIAALSQGQSWLWAKNLVNNNSGSFTQVNSTAIDAMGSIYEAGDFEGNINAGIYNLNAIHFDGLITKFDSNGNVLWAGDGSLPNYHSSCQATSIAVDTKGNAYITGSFWDTVLFGPHAISTYYNTNNAFLVKYDANGNVKWAVSPTLNSARSSCTGTAVAVDNAGNIYVTGQYTDTVNFGALKFIGSPTNIFLAKYDSNGNIIWATTTANSGGGQSYAITTDKHCNVYVTGFYLYNITFYIYPLSNHGDNVFLVKYDSSGSVNWVRCGNSSCGITSGYAVTTDNADNVYITGTYMNTIMFSYFILPYFNGGNLFLAKYSTGGGLIWAKYPTVPLGSTEVGYSLAIDKSNYLYLSGTYTDSITFGSLSLTSSAKNPSHLIKFDTSGNAICGTVINNFGNNFVVSNPYANNLYLAGNIGTFNYHPDSCAFGNDTIGSLGSGLSFLAKWQPCTGVVSGQSEMQRQNLTVNVFPDPNQGSFNLSIRNYQLGMEYRVEIYNMIGEKIYSNTFSTLNSQLSIDMGTKAPGVYMYRLINETGKQIGNGKFVIE